MFTKEQVRAIYEKSLQSDHAFLELLDKAEPTFGCDGAVAVPWCGMWLCIETDGYCHS